MIISVLKSGSKGNCAILRDINGCQLILDCGLKYETLAIELNWDNPIAILNSHKHADHYNEATIQKLISFGATVFDETSFTKTKLFCWRDWRILPIALPHCKETDSWSFLMFNSAESKSVFFATDCIKLPKIADSNVDLFMIETNYSRDNVIENIGLSPMNSHGYLNHLSLEYVSDWLSKRKNKPRNLLVTHLSNSGNIRVRDIQDRYSPYTTNLYIATKKLSFIF